MFKPEGSYWFNKIFLKNGYPSFFKINTAGWLAFILIDNLAIRPQLLSRPLDFIDNLISFIFIYVFCFRIRIYYRKLVNRNYSFEKMIIYVLLISLAVCFVWYTQMVVVASLLKPDVWANIKDFLTIKYTFYRLTIIFPIITTWSFIYVSTKFWFNWSKEKERAEHADLMAQSAQLQMLRYQVNPHFLFNSFSSLRYLINIKDSKAEELVTKLSEFYRYSLAIKNNTEVALIEEVEAMKSYLNIEKIRFGNKLEYNISIDELAEEYPIPSFMVHPLIENAIKYGMKTSEMPLRILLKAEVISGKLKIIVSNSGKWIDKENINVEHGTGTGLANIKSRLEFSYPNNYIFAIKSGKNNVDVIIEINRSVNDK